MRLFVYTKIMSPSNLCRFIHKLQDHYHPFERSHSILPIKFQTFFIMPTKKRNLAKGWSMYQSLHNDVSDLLHEHNLFFSFHEKDDDRSCLKEYDTNIMGRFTCRKPACPANGWSSKRVAITIRMYSDKRYNARVYHQYCKSCGTPSKPDLDDSYAERVAYRIKRWCGVKMVAPPYTVKRGPPHRKDLCEGCKQGHCSM
jgi:hypothetical protein